MMQVMKDIGGVELPEYLARLTPEAEPSNGTAAGWLRRRRRHDFVARDS